MVPYATARDNADMLVQNVVMRGGGSGELDLRVKGRAVTVRFERVLPETVRRKAAGLFEAAAEFRDAAAHPFHALFDLDFSDTHWSAGQPRWLSPVQAAKLIKESRIETKRREAAEALRLAAERERREKARDSVLDVDLPTADGAGMVWLAGCPTAKCLTVYVAPWCSVCREGSGAIKALRSHLSGRGITTRIVVGRDSISTVASYASEFGAKTLLDPDEKVALRGVPHFFVSSEGGAISFEKSGFFPDGSAEKNSAWLNLP
ncbi:MAG: hypothetical protein HY926_09695 [Elusimicrobia bacterium]|nr:hypothetical protein [Elusimicrobiota bacterium]